ncbi:MAG TPA: hypothetical protein VMT81_02705, partial [Candidatus Paceibacterota bacterium]|nr:hypothetical protein [Candidatus Paceibacterota bacterium]
ASSSARGTASVSFSFTMSAVSTNGETYSQSFRSSAAVITPVPVITMTQQAQANSNNPSVASVGATLPTTLNPGDALLAVVANATTSASVSLADTIGNTWNLVVSSSYPAFNQKLTAFATVNSTTLYATDTITASFGAGAGYASIFVYEYRENRGQSITFDASSFATSTSTQPSSGFANATSAAELLVGVGYDGTTAEIPAAGPGFTLETSSTVTHVFMEDSTQYITGPVAATWQYSGTAPSSACYLATFY